MHENKKIIQAMPILLRIIYVLRVRDTRTLSSKNARNNIDTNCCCGGVRKNDIRLLCCAHEFRCLPAWLSGLFVAGSLGTTENTEEVRTIIFSKIEWKQME